MRVSERASIEIFEQKNMKGDVVLIIGRLDGGERIIAKVYHGQEGKPEPFVHFAGYSCGTPDSAIALLELHSLVLERIKLFQL